MTTFRVLLVAYSFEDHSMYLGVNSLIKDLTFKEFDTSKDKISHEIRVTERASDRISLRCYK